MFCKAKAAGQAWAYWRGAHSKADMDQTLALLKEPCPQAPSACPKELAPGSVIYLNDKPYHNGVDSTVWVRGDPEFCRLIHGVAVSECHLEGWPKKTECERELLGGCPVWQYRIVTPGTFSWLRNLLGIRGPATQCLQQGEEFSCDHFGSPDARDDPDTLPFEGLPAWCGEQRDPAGHPMAGYFTVAHGRGQVRACKPGYEGATCGPWLSIDH
jgi:hypothetical protein